MIYLVLSILNLESILSGLHYNHCSNWSTIWSLELLASSFYQNVGVFTFLNFTLVEVTITEGESVKINKTTETV